MIQYSIENHPNHPSLYNVKIIFDSNYYVEDISTIISTGNRDIKIEAKFSERIPAIFSVTYRFNSTVVINLPNRKRTVELQFTTALSEEELKAVLDMIPKLIYKRENLPPEEEREFF